VAKCFFGLLAGYKLIDALAVLSEQTVRRRSGRGLVWMSVRECVACGANMDTRLVEWREGEGAGLSSAGGPSL
jgi:hypothetical protein